MEPTADFSFVMKVQFRERDLNLVGFYVVLASVEKAAVYKCAAVVNFFSESFTQKFSLTSSWVRFLDLVADEYSDLGTRDLKEYSESIRDLYQEYLPERMARMLKIVLDITDPNVQKVMMDELIKEDLHSVLPGGNIAVECTWETLGQEEKKEKKKQKEPSRQEVPSPSDGGAMEPMRTITTLSVEPEIDPVNGVSAWQLKVGDEVDIIVNRRRNLRGNGKILSMFSPRPGSDNLVITMELSTDLRGQMMVNRGMMLKSGKVKATLFQGRLTSELFFYLILAFSALIFVLFIIALGLIMTG